MKHLKNTIIVLSLVLIGCINIKAQVLTHEDSVNLITLRNDQNTQITGYGEAYYQRNLTDRTANADLARAVLFVGHKFTEKISFVSELEVEDAKVSGGESGGEVAMEQAFIRFGLGKNSYINVGLFLPRIGIMNENHLPTSYFGNERPVMETILIPSTWRELGIGLYGEIDHIQGLNYSIALVNGLNASGFTPETGIREGRFEGRNASANTFAITGSLDYYLGNFKFQYSGYYGGSHADYTRVTDSLKLKSDVFSLPVFLNEADVSFDNNGWSFKAIGCIINISDAEKINYAFNNGVSKTMIGGYAELGYDIFSSFHYGKNLIVFARYENIDMNYSLPSNLVQNSSLQLNYITTGISFLPTKGVVIKADYKNLVTGKPKLYPNSVNYYNNSNWINVGLGYSF